MSLVRAANMALAHWESKLRAHFADLRRRRSEAAGNKPLFALEHGLTPQETEALAADVRADVANSVPDDNAPLPWVVYAAELGYRYAGDEYWQSFEEQTPGWRAFGDRQWLRDCYRTFQSAYGGAVPSGPWAAQFSIICWPITHAILPRDLQRQLAQIVYELRYRFSADLFDRPELLGDLIRARGWTASSRFQQLVEEPHLVGQIAAALLLQGQFGTRGLIEPLTLQRIGTDLSAEQRSREWLRGARKIAEESAQVRGFASGHHGASGTTLSTEVARQEFAALGIEPRLALRPSVKTAGSWDLTLEIPDLSHLMVRFPDTKHILTGSRCVVNGSSGRPLASGRILHGPQLIRLERWPRHGEVLLRFEGSNAQLDALLRTECLLRPGPLWLFRIASDGLAYELRTQRVRPGNRYIALRTDGPLPHKPWLSQLTVDCSQVHAALLDLPRKVDRELEGALAALGLPLAKSVEAWPAGLDALTWDGEGRGEWFVSERPCLAVLVDHDVSALLASLDDSSPLALDLSNCRPGAPVFVQLPLLMPGRHVVRLTARAGSSHAAELIGTLDLVMRVREAPSWLGLSPHGPLQVILEPAVPTLEQLWEGRVELSVRGPAGRTVKCSVTLSDKTAVGVARPIPLLRLPVTADAWRSHFQRHVHGADSFRAYDVADACIIRFDGDDLGAFELRCEREFTPLRWVVRRSGQRYTLRLIDDSGDPSPLTVTHFGFETPNSEEAVAQSPCIDVPVPGGLFVARRGGQSAAVIVPAGVQGRGLDALRCEPRLTSPGRSVRDVLMLTTIARLWGRARLPGSVLDVMRRRAVLRAFAGEATRIIGGDVWARLEASAERRVHGFDDLTRAVARTPNERGIAPGLLRVVEDLAAKPCQARVRRLAESVATFRLVAEGPRPVLAATGGGVLRGRPAPDQDTLWLSELALRLTSDPSDTEDWAGDALTAGIGRLFDVPTLVRLARLLVLAVERHWLARDTGQRPYAGWDWA